MTVETRAKPTPGPWEAHGVEVSGGDGVLAQCGFGMRDDPETRANARLIAASPSMAALLRRLVREWDAGLNTDGAFVALQETVDAARPILASIGGDAPTERGE